MKRRLLALIVLLTPLVAAGQASTLANGACRLDGVDCGPLPSQTTHSGKYLTTDGTTASWAALSMAYSSLTGIGASKLLGRGSAGGTGVAQEITLGSGLSMSGTTLSASGGALSGGTADRLMVWSAADAATSHPGLLADDTTGALTIGAQSDIVPVTLRAYSSGTSHILQWQTSGNAALGAITHSGQLSIPGTGFAATAPILFGADGYLGSTVGSSAIIGLAGGLSGTIYLATGGLTPITFGIDSTSPSMTLGETMFTRDAAGVLAQRNGTNAQTLRIYGTYTDASNYVRASLAATSTAVTLAAETAGTGADDVPVEITPAGAGLTKVTRLRVVDSGAKPTCDSSTRGVIWMEEGGAGVADTLEVCRKDAGDAYAWTALF